MSNRIRKAKYDNIKRLNESLNSSKLLNEACINAGNNCTAAISCGGAKCTITEQLLLLAPVIHRQWEILVQDGLIVDQRQERCSGGGMTDIGIDVEKGGSDLPPLDPKFGDKKHLEQLISSMQSVDEYISWFDETYGPYREAGADIPTGQEVVSDLASVMNQGTKGRMSEQGLPVWMGVLGGIIWFDCWRY